MTDKTLEEILDKMQGDNTYHKVDWYIKGKKDLLAWKDQAVKEELENLIDQCHPATHDIHKYSIQERIRELLK